MPLKGKNRERENLIITLLKHHHHLFLPSHRILLYPSPPHPTAIEIPHHLAPSYPLSLGYSRILSVISIATALSTNIGGIYNLNRNPNHPALPLSTAPSVAR